jgi:hypothetical protein
VATASPRQHHRVASWRPTRIEEWLLVAGLGDAQEAAGAWALWKRATRGEPVAPASLRLMPLVGHNLSDHGIDDEEQEALRALRMSTWCDNQLLFHEAGELLRTLRHAGIETRVLKGAALALLAYGDPGLRPMSDVDVLVPSAQARAAMRVLADAGWTSVARSPEALIPYQHALSFENGKGGRCDLHWRLLCDGDEQASDDEYWADPIAFELAGEPAYALSASNQLLHVCVHGARWDSSPAIRWIADATWLLRAPGLTIDWPGLAAQAERRDLAVPLQATLGYLQSLLNGPIEPPDFAHVQRVRSSAVSRAIYRCQTSRRRWLRSVGRLRYWSRRWRASASRSTFDKAAEFVAYLRASVSS